MLLQTSKWAFKSSRLKWFLNSVLAPREKKNIFAVPDELVKGGVATEDTLMDVAEVIEDVASEDEIDGVEKVDNTEGVREDNMEETVKSEGEAELVGVSVDDASAPWETVEGVK